MANQQHLDLLKQGQAQWNQWRDKHPAIAPDLSNALLGRAYLPMVNLSRANLSGANLSEVTLSNADLHDADLHDADLRGAHLNKADLSRVDLRGADLSGADLRNVDLRNVDLRGADLRRAHLREANLTFANLYKANLSPAFLYDANLYATDLRGADLRRAHLKGASLTFTKLNGADLREANLIRATLVKTDLTGAILTGCSIYGISAWDVKLEGANQTNLNVSDQDEAAITVDNLEVAQFIYLLLNNTRIREVINTLTTKVALILGRFTPERKAILDALREELRTYDYLPIIFDFEKPADRNYTETIRTLAHLARFIIADLTEPSSIPQELQAIVPTLAVPVQPILLEGKKEYAMFVDLLKTYEWVLPITFYADQRALLTSLQDKVIKPAEDKAKELEKKRN
jgi:uncharacterized protein YjbI with pentapeptide repeats